MNKETAERIISDVEQYLMEHPDTKQLRHKMFDRWGNCCFMGAALKQNGYNHVKDFDHENWRDQIRVIYGMHHNSIVDYELIKIVMYNDEGNNWERVKHYIRNILVDKNE